MHVKGQWWTNETATHPVAGTFTYNEEGMMLHLEGDMSSPLLSFEQQYKPFTFFGKSGNGKCCTLEKCELTKIGGNTIGQNYATFTGGDFFYGSHMSSATSYFFKSCRVGFDQLTKWTPAKPFSKNKTDSSIEIIYKFPDDDNRVNLETISSQINFSYSYSEKSIGGHSITLDSIPHLEITPNKPEDVDWFVNTANKINKFISMLIGYECTCSSFFLQTPQTISNSITQSEYINFHSAKILNKVPTPRRESKLVFIWKKEIDEQLQIILNNWFSLGEGLENAVDLFYDAIPMRLDSKYTFLTLLFAVESLYKDTDSKGYIPDDEYKQFYKNIKGYLATLSDPGLVEKLSITLKYGNEHSLQSKLYEMLTEANESSILFSHPKDLSAAIAKKRNKFAHGRSLSASFQEVSLEIQEYNIPLKKLLAYHILKSIGIDVSFLAKKFSDIWPPPYI